MKRLTLFLALALAATGRTASQPTTAVQIDPAAASVPINPFVYGQFIEHLGRCIYGGIWAEMLEDRKFYFPVTAEFAPYQGLKPSAGTSDFNVGNLQQSAFPALVASPWEIIGTPAGVEMIKEQAFVGEHSPLIRVGHGIRHHKLGILPELDYVGYVWARPTGDRPTTVEVVLVWGNDPASRATQRLTFAPGEYSRQPFTLRSRGRTDEARLELRVHDADALVGTASLMPGDNIRGMRRDTLALLKELDSPIYRWPGGNFVSGYEWRDGIGDRDRRPPRGNPAWTGVEHNDFGTDEFLDFCREIGTTPMIAANTGFGDAYSAAQWVEYCNGSAQTLAGGWRAKNGHASAYDVKHWCVGNEMFGPWQLGFMQLHQYALKHNLVAKAMHAVDPSLVLVGVGSIDKVNKDNDPEQVKRGVTWTEGMLLSCADNMDLVSEHVYDGRLPWEPDRKRSALLQHVTLLRDAIRHVAQRHRGLQARLPNLEGRVVPIALDEWNYWHREYVYGELGCRYDLADGLGIAAGLHEIFRHSDLIQMAHYAQTVNVIGALKTTRTAAELETTGLVLALYRAHFGQIPVQISGTFEPLDLAAARSTDGRTLTVAVVNPTTETCTLPLRIAGDRVLGRATAWTIAGPDETAANTPGQPRAIDIVRAEGIDATQPLRLQPLSCTLVAIPLE
ncbi:MAG TPA: alpha-L-arabinofuranosidase C-terminal domain-containing protein [Opitutaceae bacterium]|nr:alpha-L-arabinofuranosidase C-terminal domain-containing protein [Opitutaceae bacterium]